MKVCISYCSKFEKKKKRKGELWFPKIKNFQSKLKTIQTIKKKFGTITSEIYILNESSLQFDI